MIKKLFTRKVFTIFAVLFALMVLAFPSQKVCAVDGCQTKAGNCKAQADGNYSNCMASPVGTYVVCSAWWYYDMSACSGC